MRRSIGLRKEPTMRQTTAILGRIEGELTELGARVERGSSALRFRMPAPWRAPHLGFLLAITSGIARVSAGSGEHRQVRYELRFSGLRIVALLVTLGVTLAGWGWSRGTLLVALLVLWAVVYGLPRLIAGRLFHRLIATSAREIVERRRHSRDTSTPTPTGEFAPYEPRPEGGANPGDQTSRARADSAD
jgi:hypothetical protein